MILVIGGEASGKKDYVKSLGYHETDMTYDVKSEKPVLLNLHDIVAKNPEKADELVRLLLKKEVVVCNEVGSGVIPLQRADRAAREATGRLCICLAKNADKVVRMICGIPQQIK